MRLVVSWSHTARLFEKDHTYLLIATQLAIMDGWLILMRSLMNEEGLGKVVSGAETTPPGLEDAAP